MDAVKFVQDYIRLCAQQEDCDTCPIYKIEGVDFCTAMPKERSLEGCEKLVALTNAWALAHPRKTRQDMFLKQYPNAPRDCEGILMIDPCDLDLTIHGKDECYTDNCLKCHYEYWLKVIE